MHIEIVSSSKTWLSSMSQPSREAARTLLAKHYSNVSITLIDTMSDLEALTDHKPDLVFLGMKYVPANNRSDMQEPANIWISKYLEERGIACTGSGSTAHQLELSKPDAKQCATEAGLKTSPFYVVSQDNPDFDNCSDLTYPLFIKPANRGGGLGIDKYSVAHNFAQLKTKVESITVNLGSDSLVEEFLPGREFSVAILKDAKSYEYTAMPIELVAEADDKGVRMLGGEVKSSNTERVLEVTDKDVRSKVNTLALDVFHALGARDYGRIDIRMDENGTPHFLEANLIPSLISGYGSFPKACKLNKATDYEEMMLNIVQLGLTRSRFIERSITTEAEGSTAMPAFQPALEI